MQSTATSAKSYSIDEAHSSIRFWVRHLMISKVHGEIPDITGTVVYDDADPASAKIDVTIQLKSLTTKQDQRDGHLKSADFFDVENFPTMTYTSTSVTSNGEGNFTVDGNLTLHGVTKPVALEAEITPEITSPFGGFKVGVSAKGKLNREDFGMTWNQAIEAGGVAVGKEVTFEIDLELDRPA
jgi:polyisoprenoid-binding protein YceI